MLEAGDRRRRTGHGDGGRRSRRGKQRFHTPLQQSTAGTANGTKVQYRVPGGHREDDGMLHSGRVLDPFDRVSEIIFGVLMAMTFIGAMNVATAGAQEVRTVMKAALGCNIAWGLTDGVMYLVGLVTERTREKTQPRLKARDFQGALGIFLLVTVSTFPLVVPFLLW